MSIVKSGGIHYGTSKENKSPITETDIAVWTKEALMENQDMFLFQKLVPTTYMPKHHGNLIRTKIQYKILDDRNINDQGIDARGTYLDKQGNLYGSSRDLNKVAGAIPWIGEDGGYINRVGIADDWIEATLNNIGFFMEWTEDFENYTSNENFRRDTIKEMIHTASTITDDLIQIDLLNSAGALFYPGSALSDEQVDKDAVVNMQTLRKLRNFLEENNIPEEVTIIKGSTRQNTYPLRGGYILFTTPQVADYLSTLPGWRYRHEYAAGETDESSTAFKQYERGSINGFRVLATSRMLKWLGSGSRNIEGVEFTGDKVDIHPILFVGPDAFASVSMHIDGSAQSYQDMLPFVFRTKTPGNIDRSDAYDMYNMASIRWKYGCLIKRPHHIALIKTAVPTNF